MIRLGYESENKYCLNRLWGCNLSIEHSHFKTFLVIETIPYCPICNKPLVPLTCEEYTISPLFCKTRTCKWHINVLKEIRGRLKNG